MANSANLLIITDTYVGRPGGSERHLHNFLTSISDDFQVNVIQMIPSGNPMLADGPLVERSNVTLYSRPLTGVRSKNMLYLIIELWKLIRKNEIDLVISYHEKSDIINYVLRLLPGISFTSVSSKRDMGFKLEGNLKRLMYFITPKLKNITAPSRSIAKQMVDEFGIPQHDTHVIPNGVDLAAYNIMTDEGRIKLKGKLGLPINTRVMSSVGWLKPVKGHKYLLDAFSLFTKKHSSKWILVLLGEGELEDELKAQAKKLGILDNVFFVGFQDNVQEWLGASDLMVSATLSEGLSNALIEAVATGLPIIATNVGGNPEVVEHGFNGLLVESEDSLALCNAIEEITSNEKKYLDMSKNSRIKAERDFSNDTMVERLETLYKSLLGYK
ncbi:MAG: glycosyltransferase family 4 protein [Oleispira sp.]|nr:glycosyltransferase family 4 protein [Oleispira sp.]MBL4880075.1 glycosyltransferase family 4 protein [Oleispira sp.]